MSGPFSIVGSPEPLCWLGGRVIPEREATIPVRDRGFQLGLGAFETVRVVGGKPFRAAQHLDRLMGGLAEIETLTEDHGVVMSAARRLAGAIPELLARWGRHDGVLKLFVTLGDPPDLAPAILATVRGRRALPDGARERGVALGFADGPSPYPWQYKGLGRLGRWLERERGRARGFFDVLYANPVETWIEEGTATNVFLVREGRLRTPHAGAVLEGIARGVVLGEVARAAGVEVSEDDCFYEDLISADEVFLTNALIGVLPVARVGDEAVRACPGPVTADLAARLEALVAAECGGG